MAEIATVRPIHDAIIDSIIAHPEMQQKDLAQQFGYTQTWMSIIINSDAFKERLAERKAELVDPKIRATIQDRLDGIAKRAMDKIIERLDSPAANIKHMELVAMAKLGVGDRNNHTAQPTVQNSLYVIAMPPPAENSTTWLANRQIPRGPSLIIENQPGV